MRHLAHLNAVHTQSTNPYRSGGIVSTVSGETPANAWLHHLPPHRSDLMVGLSTALRAGQATAGAPPRVYTVPELRLDGPPRGSRVSIMTLTSRRAIPESTRRRDTQSGKSPSEGGAMRLRTSQLPQPAPSHWPHPRQPSSRRQAVSRPTSSPPSTPAAWGSCGARSRRATSPASAHSVSTSQVSSTQARTKARSERRSFFAS